MGNHITYQYIIGIYTYFQDMLYKDVGRERKEKEKEKKREAGRRKEEEALYTNGVCLTSQVPQEKGIYTGDIFPRRMESARIAR